jgi:hypothetical protein
MALSTALVAAWLVSLSGISQPHAETLAAPIVEAATTVEEAALLAVTLDAEGGVRRRVMDCRILGDHGRAFGGWQIHRQHWVRYTVAEFCRSPKLQAEIAIKCLSHGVSPRTRIAAFMGRRESDKEVNRRVIRFERLLTLGEGS